MTSSAPMIQSKLAQVRRAWRLSFIAGLLILALTVLSTLQNPAQPCGELQEGYAPIVAFELARNEADLLKLFGPPADPCRAEMIASMDAVNWVDVLVFIPVYGFFMVCFFLGMSARDTGLARIGVQLAILAVVADYVENACLMNLTPQLDAASGWLALLPWATGVKWIALGAAAAVAGLIYMKSKPGTALSFHGLAALICWVAFLTTIAAIAAPLQFGPVLSLAIAASWLVYLVTGGLGTFRSNA